MQVSPHGCAIQASFFCQSCNTQQVRALDRPQDGKLRDFQAAWSKRVVVEPSYGLRGAAQFDAETRIFCVHNTSICVQLNGIKFENSPECSSSFCNP